MADDQKSGDTLHMEKAESITKNGGGNWEEEQYLRLIKELISEYEAGRKKIRMERTGVGTLSTFMRQFRYNLKGGRFPLLTTKRVFWRGVVEELLWFVKGSTNANELSEKEVKIWDLNASRSFLDSQGLHHRQQGDLGPVYGFQWRHAGAPYADMHTDYSGLGVDQLAEVIEQIRKNPMSRRLLVSSWNPKDVPLMALPPCHCLFQFYVDDEQALSLSMYQRSADLGLGVPFNIASYALLLRMVACLVGLEAGEFIHNTADTHIYSNHIEPLKQQLQRTPRDFPTLHIKRKVERIEDFVAEDFELLNYKPHPSIKMEMAV